MKTLGRVKRTARGFELIEFEDCYGKKCDLQASSLAAYVTPGTSAVWLGPESDRMHLNRKQVAALIAHLSAWLETGSFRVAQPARKASQKKGEA